MSETKFEKPWYLNQFLPEKIIYLFIYLYIEGQNPWSTNNRTQGPLHRSTSKRSLDVTENRVGTSIRTTLIYRSKQHIHKDKTKI